MGKKRDILNVMYFCVHRRLQSEADVNGIIARKKFIHILGRNYHVNRKLSHAVLKEMIILDLLECPNPASIKILPSYFDLENIQDIQRRLGFY